MISHPCTDSTEWAQWGRREEGREREGERVREGGAEGEREREIKIMILGVKTIWINQKNWRGANRDRFNQNTLYAYTKFSIKMEK